MNRIDLIPQNLKKFRVLLLLGFLLAISLSVYLIFFNKKENDDIYEVGSNNVLFRNENPNFKVDFVKDNSSTYIRFESKGSDNNPFEDKDFTLVQQVKEKLNIGSDSKGIILSLKGISYDETMREIIGRKDSSLELNEQENSAYDFQLTESGERIGGNEDEAVSQKTVISKDVSQGIDIEYQILPGKGLKEEIVLNSMPSYTEDCGNNQCSIPANVYYFDLKLDEGLEIKQDISSGSYYITDQEGKYYSHFLPEYASDALGNKTNDVKVEIEDQGSNNYTVKMALDANWLLSTDRVFPVKIDPSIVHDTSTVINQGTFEGTKMISGPRIQLEDSSTSGDYTSDVIDIGDNSKIKDISVKDYSSKTSDGEVPFSTTNLIAQWNLNETHGLVAEDTSACGSLCNLNLKGFVDTSKQDALISSGWTSIYRKWGVGALMFDGVDDYAVGNVIDLSKQSVYSVELWLMPVNTDSSQYIMSSNLGSLIIDKGEWNILNGTDIVDTGIKVDFYNWNHIVVMFDKSSSKANFYANANSFEIDNYNPVILGSDYIYIGGNPSLGYFKGIVDVSRVYSRALTESEIYSNSQSGYLGLEYRTSADGESWEDWQGYFNKGFDISKVISTSYSDEKTQSNNQSYSVDLSSQYKNLTMYFDPIDVSGDKLISFLVAGDKAVSQPSIQYQTQDMSTDGDNNDSLVKSLSFLLNWESSEDQCIATNSISSEYSIQIGGEGQVTLNFGDLNLVSSTYLTEGSNYIYIENSNNKLELYINGIFAGSIDSPEDFVLGEGVYSTNNCQTQIEQFKTSSSTLSDAEIRNSYTNVKNSSPIEIRFEAKLQNSNLITDSSDTSFAASEIDFGSQQTLENINIGDVVVIKEDTYIAQGEVSNLNKVTGSITVKGWNSDSTFPQGGFDTNAQVLKWQRVYVDTRNLSEDFKTKVNSIIVENDGKGDYMFKDFEAISPYDTSKEWDFSNISSKYLQYRVVFSTLDLGIQPYITQIQLDYDILGPTMDKVMRHGQWFDNDQKQSFWWAD